MITQNRSGAKNRQFWDTVTKARKKIETWPEWKRNLRVAKYSAGFNFDKPEQDFTYTAGEINNYLE